MIKVVSDPKECEIFLKNHYASILDSYGYKKILNEWYKPEKFLFFLNENSFLPLVAKENMASFYGGTAFNSANRVPNDKILINYALDYLLERDISFRLLCITNDIFDFLEEPVRKYDVPYPPQWVYEVVKPFDALEYIRSKPTKKRRKTYRYIYNRKRLFDFKTFTFGDLERYFPSIMKKHIDYFDRRGKKSAWEKRKLLLFSILKYFYEKENLYMRGIFFENTIVGFYAIAYNKKEVVLYFGGTFETDDCHLSKIWYFDMMEQSTLLACSLGIKSINALRGNFVNKRRFGFVPHPLYALVCDKNWVVARDGSVTKDEYEKIYHRFFGAESLSAQK